VFSFHAHEIGWPTSTGIRIRAGLLSAIYSGDSAVASVTLYGR
jgi:hypothetical protein